MQRANSLVQKRKEVASARIKMGDIETSCFIRYYALLLARLAKRPAEKKKKRKKESELGQINIGQRGKISTLKRREVESRPNSCPIRHDRIERHIKSDLFRDYVNVCDTDTTPQLISCADALSEWREIVLDLVSRGKTFEETSERVFCDLLFYDLGFPNALVYLLLTRSLTTNTMWIRVDRYF